MIIGSGFIANAFKSLYEANQEVCIYAAGVSNSRCTDKSDFLRDQDLLKKILSSLNKNELIVYFSTCSIGSVAPIFSSQYIEHKKRMEALVSEHNKFLILRVPQLAGFSKNNFTLLNYFSNKIQSGESFQALKNGMRNILDIEHLASITHDVIKGHSDNLTMNIANPISVSVPEILLQLECTLKKKPVCEFIDASHDNYDIDVAEMIKRAEVGKYRFDQGYLSRVIKKYYGAKL
ncbi:hypothetical protein G6646_00125 [Polynucleobacter paneuropaeus]|nr:hypothetical protein [Polynucleobacter paneuropaeus]